MSRSTHALPAQIGRYQIVRRLGAGGMAEVFLAKSTGVEGIEKILVVKRVLPNFARRTKFITMFLEEAKIATRLNHPNIVQVYAFEQVADEFLLAMEFVDGPDIGKLGAAARRKGTRIPFGTSAFIAHEVAKGLDYAHRRKDERHDPMDIVHRDISPQNILLSYEGSVKIADFGIAKARKVSEESGVIKGKFGYMAPEQARGQAVDQRSDIYSLGILLAEMLMGRNMFPGRQGVEVLEDVRRGNITPPSQVDATIPTSLCNIVEKATHYLPENRYQTARELAADLHRYLRSLEDVHDGESLEQFIAEVLPRDLTHPDELNSGIQVDGEGASATVDSSLSHPDQEVRERRHVVIVSGRVIQRNAEDISGFEVGPKFATLLADLAYKNDAVLSWEDGDVRRRFRFIVGLRRASVHDPLTAMRLSLDVHEAVAGFVPDGNNPIQIALGVTRGVVATVRDSNGILLDYDPKSKAFQLAHKLADLAVNNETRVTSEIYRLTRRDFLFHATPPDSKVQASAGSEQHLSASVGPVPQAEAVEQVSFKLEGIRSHASRAAELVDHQENIVGRQEERRLLGEMFQEAIASSRSIGLVVTGEVGVGKTYLTAAAIAEFVPKPHMVHTECAFGTSDAPLSTARQILRQTLGLTEQDSPEIARERLQRQLKRHQIPGADHHLLEALVHGSHGGISQQPGGTNRIPLLAQAVATFLEAIANTQPHVLWVDSSQWIDSPSLELFASVLRSQVQAPLLVLFCARPDTRIERALSAVPHIELDELEESHSHELVRRRFPNAQITPSVLRLVTDRAGGNPLFIAELLETLLERGVVKVLVDRDGHSQIVRSSVSALALPATLEGVVASRLDELPEIERRMLRWIAVLGSGFSSDDLREITGQDPGTELDNLEKRNLLIASVEGRFRFPSTVLRQVVYETTDEEDRTKMHRRVGRWMSNSFRPFAPARVARHLEKAKEYDSAADAYLRAATSARATYANREALRFFSRALSLLPAGSPNRFFAHEAREQMLRGMDRPAEQVKEIEAMRAHADRNNDPSMQALAFNRLARHQLDQGNHTGVHNVIKQSIAAALQAQDAGAEIEALRLAAQLARMEGSMETALQACERALKKCGLRRERLAARGSVLVQKALILHRMNRIASSLEASSEAVVVFRRLGFRRNESQALNALGVTLAASGAWEDAVAVLCASIRIDREIGDKIHLGRKLSDVGQLHADMGNYRSAGEFLGRSIEVFERGHDRVGYSHALSTLAEVHIAELSKKHDVVEGVHHGNDSNVTDPDTNLILNTLDHARDLAKQTGDRVDLARERLVRATWHRLRGSWIDTESCLREALAIARAARLEVLELLANAALAEALVERGQKHDASLIIQSILPQLELRDGLERSEQVLFFLRRAMERIGVSKNLASLDQFSRNIVGRRLSQIRGDHTRDQYLDTPQVQSITSVAPVA